MSVNKYMHPRNIYKQQPNFKQLALDYPEFRKFVKTDLSGNVIFDFKNTDALRTLSCTLLKKDFDLEVEIPLNKLIPTIPLRLNYILWLEDLFETCSETKILRGIDIGTGASCVYPLLAAKKNGWSMLATEVDKESLLCAKNNVIQNSLTDLIEVIPVDDSVLLKEVIKNEHYDFCMCNPPFFGSTQELHPNFKSRKPDRPKPKNSFCASVKEVVVNGGEVDFIYKLISDSKDLGKQVTIYTCMLGHKKSLPLLKTKLRQVNVSSFKETEFCQGNTTRWGLAWTYCENIDLKKCPEPIKQLQKKKKPKDPLIYKVPVATNVEESFNIATENIVKLFQNIKMIVANVSKTKDKYRCVVRAFSNTWSNQRRKRRELLKNQSETLNSIGEQNTSSSSLEDTEIEMNVKSPGKRESEDCLEGNTMKKMKITDCDVESDFFRFTVDIQMCDLEIIIQMDCSIDSNREYLHQIHQYVKNNLKV